MRKVFVLFVAIALCAPFGVGADDVGTDTARAATRGGTISVGAPSAATVSAATPGTRGTNTRAPSSTTTTSPSAGASVGRNASVNASRDAGVATRESPSTQTGRSAVSTVREVSQRAATPDTSRGASNITSRAAAITNQAPVQSATRGISRGVPTTSSATTTTTSRSGITPTAISSRAANLNTGSLTFGAKDYATCRDTYFQCMDEFCANKDAQLRRCACSKRVRDFDKAQQNLEKFENKMLDFNERLLTVSMDKEDAAAINKATEGEQAFQVDDDSPSQKILDTIRKKLDATNADNRDMQSLAMISLSIDTTNVFDTIDSTLGASTATKEGDALYRSALPVCKDIAAEVCSPDDISIAEAAYQMAIEQDCNTVSKAYESLQASAIQKVREGSALLDMSRLQDYQTRNADDTLACKTKMLEMLYDDVVCGDNLEKCLDWSGKYIDPSTGSAMLTNDLSKLSDTLKAPTNDVAKWVQMKENQGFVKFLNAKKKYIEPAMTGCEDIADMVWNDFMEDALAQIKISQNNKLEEMRQSCTSVTATCLAGQAQSLTDFDARALSIFGVSADRTVNQLCAHVKTACTALVDTGGSTDWSSGMTEIARDKSFDQVIATCLEVGKNCIVQNCVSSSGNFGLCDRDTAINRKILLNRTICWPDVRECVQKSASKTELATGAENQINRIYNTYYKNNTNLTADDNQACVGIYNETERQACVIAKSIWGTCDRLPTSENSKIQPTSIKNSSDKSYDTILHWLNKNTPQAGNSCYANACPEGMEADSSGYCQPKGGGSEGSNPDCIKIYTVYGNWTNCCDRGVQDDYGNCCADGQFRYVPVDVFDNSGDEFFRSYTRSDVRGAYLSTGMSVASRICSPHDLTFIAKYKPDASGFAYLFCTSSGGTGQMSGTYTTGGNGKCNGKFLEIRAGTQAYMTPNYTSGGGSKLNVKMSYKTNNGDLCIWDDGSVSWAGHDNCNQITNILNGVKKMITY